ncbi:hypothetical protein TDSAC_0285 [Thermodesulfobium acidiphilum]|uniref:SUF system FeS cluster assembly SufBD core domain-containing protein n=1 Tax=Thermodesulfobium acidiphilum TaxID=1794699 RepID=A0A2R4VYX3_THEAF|nr:SufD family Fe-S cluster assembly protein [Thermodesulfobium acidiphilum]AWB09668.1 hypothetical protein TDSAC_0285 [Thermodesulfobium acidiphilum]PMP85127.1 MAG: ABC transporter ATP-binding protein [Thermodesulfobium narugense]
MPISEKRLSEIISLANAAREKKAVFGPDVDLERFKELVERDRVESLASLKAQTMEAAIMSGMDIKEETRSGSFFQLNHSVIYESLNEKYKDQLQIMSTDDALSKFDWIEDYFWRVVKPDQDKYTAAVALNPTHGYFMRVFPNQHVEYPLQACLLIDEGNISQNVHNIIIVEEGASLNVITGCSLSKNDAEGIHLGISEFYVKKGASLTFTMIHNWADNFDVRPRTGVYLEEDARYVNNYILLKPVKSIQSAPNVYLAGENATAQFNNVIYGLGNSYIDLGSKMYLDAPNTRAESIARTIAADKSVIYSRGDMIARTKDFCMAHLDCRGIVFSKEATMYAIPALVSEGSVKAHLSHEASIGPISQEQVEYLMSRGIEKDDAVSLITTGFLNLNIPYIPAFINNKIKDIINATAKDAL